MSSSKSIIVLDRDGVINEDLWGYVTKKEEFKFIEGSIEAIRKLHESGYTIAIATNQACINKKIISEDELKEVHDYMNSVIESNGGYISYIAFCPHVPEEKCLCRKPAYGLLEDIEKNLNTSVKQKYFVGDKESDIQCALNYDCVPILVKTGYGNKTLLSPSCPSENRCFDNLLAAVEYILEVD